MKRDVFALRRDRLAHWLTTQDCPSMLVTHPVNVTYLTGFTGDDSFLWLAPRRCILISDFRYREQLREECPDLEVQIRRVDMTLPEATAKVMTRSKCRDVGFEAPSVTVQLHSDLVGRTPRVNWIPLVGSVEQFRQVKDAGEIEEIRQAVQLAERAIQVVRATWNHDQTEAHLAADLESWIRKFGGQGCSFPPIVAVGPRAALPHAKSGTTPVGDAELILIDWGARARLYVSDLTRVFATHKISPKLRKIYEIVGRAQQHAIRLIRPGERLARVDRAARAVIEAAGFGKFFGHGLGHGIGLQVHEAPRLAPNQDRLLETGMIVTVEPGIYLPRWGGVRIEDDVLVTQDGHEVLSSYPRDIDDCVVP